MYIKRLNQNEREMVQRLDLLKFQSNEIQKGEFKLK